MIDSSPSGARRAVSVVLAAGVLALASAGAAAWRASSHGAPEPFSEQERAAVAEAVRQFLSISTHLRASGGDARYVERLPADQGVTDELMGEVRLLALGRRVEVPRLVRLEVAEVRPSGPDGALARTKEYWITREAGSDRPPRSDVVLARYELRRGSGGWQIASWDVELSGVRAGGP